MTDTTTTTTTPQPGATPPPAAPQPRAGFLEDRAYDALPPAEQTKYARVSKGGHDGGSEWIARDSLPGDKVEAKPGATDAVDPTKMGAGEKIKLTGKDGADFELDANDIARLMEAHASEAMRKTQVPADANGYTPTLPESFKPPKGIEFKVDGNDPALADLKAWAHKRGLTQSEFSDILGIDAARQVRQQELIQTGMKRQLELLGTTATQRVDAVETFLRGQLGDQLAGKMRPMIMTAGIVEGFEKLMKKFAGDHGSFTQSHRVPNDTQPGRVDDATYERMTAGERYNYSKGFDQKQFTEGRRGKGGEVR